MKVGSLFSGMEGFGHGLKKAGMELVWWVENDKNCHKVLKARYPEAHGVSDVQKASKENLKPVDVITFGWPCQDLSVAGNREGLDGSRSGLFFEAMRIIAELSPKWFIAENVPGLLSAGGRRDMGTVIRHMEELGYCVSWAMLDTQYFHLAQRRERLFFVGSLGNTGSIQVLFEPDCGPWDSPPSREKRKEVAGTIGGGSESSKRGWRNDLDTNGAYVIKGAAIGRKPEAGPQFGEILEDDSCYTLQTNEVHAVAYGGNRTSGPRDMATACNAKGGTGRHDFESETFVLYENHGQDSRIKEVEVCPQLNQKAGTGGNNLPLMAFVQNTRDEVRLQGGDGQIVGALPAEPGMKQQTYIAQQVQWASGGGEVLNDTAQALRSGAEHNYQFIQTPLLVRRLTPTECLRLMGFPDDYLSGLGLSDSAKYRMIGNSVSPVVVEWIGKRIMECF